MVWIDDNRIEHLIARRTNDVIWSQIATPYVELKYPQAQTDQNFHNLGFKYFWSFHQLADGGYKSCTCMSTRWQWIPIVLDEDIVAPRHYEKAL